MIKIIPKAIATIVMAYFNYITISITFESVREFEGQLPAISDWLTPGALIGLFMVFYTLFAYRLWAGAKGWGWYLAANITLIIVALFAYSPVPGP